MARKDTPESSGLEMLCGLNYEVNGIALVKLCDWQWWWLFFDAMKPMFWHGDLCGDL